jgi:hypothetical protein
MKTIRSAFLTVSISVVFESASCQFVHDPVDQKLFEPYSLSM